MHASKKVCVDNPACCDSMSYEVWTPAPVKEEDGGRVCEAPLPSWEREADRQITAIKNVTTECHCFFPESLNIFHFTYELDRSKKVV